MKISGKGMSNEAPYSKKAGNGYDIDTEAIESRIEAYVEEASAASAYSVSGLCIALGITRDTLELWREGYVSARDKASGRVSENEELAECVARGELYIHRYWEESDKSTTLHTKFLESAGILGERQAKLKPPFDLGRLKKYAK